MGRCAGLGGGAAFAREVGYVPATAFELNGRRGEQLLHRTAAFRTLLHQRIGKLLDLFKAVLTLFALIFVERHSGYLCNMELDVLIVGTITWKRQSDPKAGSSAVWPSLRPINIWRRAGPELAEGHPRLRFSKPTTT